MKQRITIKLEKYSKKYQDKAMKIAKAASGVESVDLQNDSLVIIGDGVDSARLTERLRGKVCGASLDTVEEIIEKVEDEKKGAAATSTSGEKKEPQQLPTSTPPPIIEPPQPQQHLEYYYHQEHHPNPQQHLEYYDQEHYPNPCTIA